MNTQTKGKKIIHVVQHLAPGGLETLTLDLLQFANKEDQVLIVSLEGTREQALKNWAKLEPFQSQLVFLDKAPGVQLNVILTLMKAFQGVKPDVVHTHHIGPLLYAGYAAKITGVPARIHTEHDAWHLNNTKRRRIQDMALKAAQPTLVADATCVYDQLKSTFSYANITTIKNGIDCQKFKPSSKETARDCFSLPQDKTLVGCAGRLEVVKGQDQLIKALTLIPTNTLVVFAGEGSQKEELQQLATKLHVADRVIFLGLVDDMVNFYRSLDVFCLPSRHEGLPLSTLEAQSCNIPTVAMDVGAVNETLCPKTGYLVKSNHIPHLSHALLQAIADNKNCNDLSQGPRQFILTNFDVRNMVESYNDIANGAYA